MAHAEKVMAEELLKQPGMRRMSVLERNRAALEFVKMNESPDKYLLHNRYIERGVLPGMEIGDGSNVTSQVTLKKKLSETAK